MFLLKHSVPSILEKERHLRIMRFVFFWDVLQSWESVWTNYRITFWRNMLHGTLAKNQNFWGENLDFCGKIFSVKLLDGRCRFFQKWNHACYVQVDLENPRSSKSPDLCLTSMKCQQNSNIKLQVASFLLLGLVSHKHVIHEYTFVHLQIWTSKQLGPITSSLIFHTTWPHPQQKTQKTPIIEKHPPWRLGGFWASSSSNPPSCVMPWSGGSCRPTTATAMRWCV